MRISKGLLAGAVMLAACSAAPSTQAGGGSAVGVPSQRGDGHPYEILGTQVFDLPDPASDINYQVFINLPPSYGTDTARTYPVVFVTDADYGFPMLRLIGRRMNGAGPKVEEFILVGLSYEKGQESMVSRRRDYTPTPNGASDAPKDARHGESLRYRDYLRDTVMPFVEARFRAEPSRRVYVGHSYGGLLGAQILMTDPEMFSGYVLGSPSFWYDKKYLLKQAPRLLDQLETIDADVYMYVGEYEALRVGDRRYMQEVDMVADNRAFAEMLHSKDYPALNLQSDVLLDEDHMSVAPRGFTKGLLHTLHAR